MRKPFAAAMLGLGAVLGVAGCGDFLTGPKLHDHIATRDELTARAAAVYAAVAAGELDVRIGHRYPLAEARTAHEDLQSRRTTGKLLLQP